MRSAIALSAAVFLLAAVGIVRGADAAPTITHDATIVPPQFQPLHDRWQTIVKELNIPGVAIVAVKGDKVVLLDALGVCDPAGKQPVTPRSPFYLASVTKSFTALGVALLVEEGKLKLDEPVKTYLPRFALADAAKAQTITLRDLLSHRYGLDSQSIAMSEAYFGNINDERYYRLLAGVRPRNFAYSNLQYTLLGRVIEAVSGKTWQEFLAERVFAPIGMRDATCYASKLYANPLAAWPIVGGRAGWELAPLVKNDSVMHAAGGMGASASDLANWISFHLSGKTPDGRALVSKELLQEIHTLQAPSQIGKSASSFKRTGYALGWFTGTFCDRPMLEHGGGYIGTATQVSLLPEENIGVAVLVNESRPALPTLVTSDVYAKLLDTAVEDLLPLMRQNQALLQARAEKAAAETWQPPSADRGLGQPIEHYVGNYDNPIWGDARVANDNGKLTLEIGKLKVRWHALGPDQFRVSITPGDVFEGKFSLDADGTVKSLLVQTPLGGTEFRKTP